DFARGQTAVQIIDLGHDADTAFHCHWIARYVNFFDPSNATGRKHSGRENTDGRCLAGAVRTEQAKKFASRHFKRNTFEGLDLDTLPRLRLVGLLELFNCDYCLHKGASYPNSMGLEAGYRPLSVGSSPTLNESTCRKLVGIHIVKLR